MSHPLLNFLRRQQPPELPRLRRWFLLLFWRLLFLFQDRVPSDSMARQPCFVLTLACYVSWIQTKHERNQDEIWYQWNESSWNSQIRLERGKKTSHKSLLLRLLLCLLRRGLSEYMGQFFGASMCPQNPTFQIIHTPYSGLTMLALYPAIFIQQAKFRL